MIPNYLSSNSRINQTITLIQRCIAIHNWRTVAPPPKILRIDHSKKNKILNFNYYKPLPTEKKSLFLHTFGMQFSFDYLDKCIYQK